MRKLTFPAPLVLAGGALVILVMAAVSTSLEARPYLSSGFSSADKFDALAEGRLAIGLSISGKGLVLDDCVSAITSVYGRVQPADRRQAVFDACQSAAAQVTDRAPSDSFGWYVGALAAGEGSDASVFNRQLTQSEVTGPNEQWIAELRADLGEDHYGELDEAARAAHQRDLALLVESQRGIATIAKRYIDQPDFRERITAIVETLPLTDQKRFLANVKRAAAPT